jgi:hypothetical protein
MFSSSAWAPASSSLAALSTQPPLLVPLRLAITGIDSSALARSTRDR